MISFSGFAQNSEKHRALGVDSRHPGLFKPADGSLTTIGYTLNKLLRADGTEFYAFVGLTTQNYILTVDFLGYESLTKTAFAPAGKVNWTYFQWEQ